MSGCRDTGPQPTETLLAMLFMCPCGVRGFVQFGGRLWTPPDMAPDRSPFVVGARVRMSSQHSGGNPGNKGPRRTHVRQPLLWDAVGRAVRPARWQTTADHP